MDPKDISANLLPFSWGSPNGGDMIIVASAATLEAGRRWGQGETSGALLCPVVSKKQTFPDSAPKQSLALVSWPS